MASPSPENRFTVFISHAEEDKATIALPLRKDLLKLGFRAFVDVVDVCAGENETSAIHHAIDTAPIAVIVLSPEYIATKQPMHELQRLHRRCTQPATRYSHTKVVPFYYRLSPLELRDEPRVDRLGDSLYQRTQFWERMSNGEPEANLPAIRTALQYLAKHKGVHNHVDAENGSSVVMARRRAVLLRELCEKITQIVPGRPERPQTELRNAPEKVEEFRAYYEEQHELFELVLDFDARDGNSKCMTQEGEILKMVLDKSSVECKSIVIRGMPGVGKTSLLRGLLQLDSLKKHFRDGVHFMSLGSDATELKMVESIASCVSNAGGQTQASRILAEEKFSRAANYFRSWFSLRECLFMVDDIWETDALPASLIQEFLGLMSNGRSDKVLLTTRSLNVASLARKHILLEPRKPFEAEARAMLSRYSGIAIPLNMDGTSRNAAVTKILTQCCGLPLFLAVAGRAIRILSFRKGCGKSLAVNVYASNQDANMAIFVNTDIHAYERLCATLFTSLELLDQKMSSMKFRVPLSAAEMYRRLCVLERQEWVPMNVLQYLWELDSKPETEAIAFQFEQLAMAEIDFKEDSRSGYLQRLRLHDLLHSFATTEAKKHEVMQTAHDAVVKKYGANLEAVTKGCRMWWSHALTPDGYIHENLCRHLLGSARYGEVLQLLFNPKWIVRMFQLCGIGGIERDFSVCIEALGALCERVSTPEDKPSNEDRFLVKSDTIKAMELLSVTISATSGYIDANFSEFPFQVCGRLAQYSKRFNEIADFLKLLEAAWVGPWIRSIRGALPHPSLSNKLLIFSHAPILCMVMIGDGSLAACGCEDGTIIIVNVARCTIESTWKAHSDRIRGIAVGRKGAILVSTSRARNCNVKVWDTLGQFCLQTITARAAIPKEGTEDGFFWSSPPYCVAVLEDGNHIFIGFERLGWAVWSIETGMIAYGPFGGNSIVESVVPLRDGEHVVTAGRFPLLQCWNWTTGDKAGHFQGHERCTESVLITSDGTSIVSGSHDGTARMWELTRHTEIREPFRDPKNTWIRRLALSDDGCMLAAACGFTKQVIRIWNVESGEEICQPLSDHTSEVTGMSFLPGKNLLVSCSRDATVRTWEVKADNCDARELDASTVRKVCFTPDGTHVISASNEKTLRVWNVATGEQIGNVMEGHSAAVADGAITEDGQSFVSVDDDLNVYRWNLETHEPLDVFQVPRASELLDDLNQIEAGEERIRIPSISRFSKRLLIKVSQQRRAFISDDGKRLVTVDDIRTPQNRSRSKRSIAFNLSRSNTSISRGHIISVWDVSSKRLVKQVHDVCTVNMSRREVLQIAGEEAREQRRLLDIPVGGTRIRFRGRVIATFEAPIRCSAWRDAKTFCVGLESGQVGIMTLMNVND